MSLASRSARMPPGFMNASCAPPRAAVFVASYCASAITSPRVDSPSGEAVRVRSPWILPMIWFASGAAAVTYCWTTPATVGSANDGSGCRTTPEPDLLSAFLIRMLLAAADTSSPLVSLTCSVRSDSTRPNDDALVSSRVTPLVVSGQRYCAVAGVRLVMAGAIRYAGRGAARRRILHQVGDEADADLVVAEARPE